VQLNARTYRAAGQGIAIHVVDGTLDVLDAAISTR
jgi:hypothetical protein